MRTWALIKDNLVENIILWDGETEWSPPAGYLCIETTGVEPAPGPGWRYIDGIFSNA